MLVTLHIIKRCVYLFLFLLGMKHVFSFSWKRTTSPEIPPSFQNRRELLHLQPSTTCSTPLQCQHSIVSREVLYHTWQQTCDADPRLVISLQFGFDILNLVEKNRKKQQSLSIIHISTFFTYLVPLASDRTPLLLLIVCYKQKLFLSCNVTASRN